jgi:small subunit ribosomal protein S17
MTKTLTGIVSSNKSNKTIVVILTNHRIHPIYKKGYQVTRKIMAHDESNEANIGDKVLIAETTPLSAKKRFKLKKVLEKAGIEHQEPETDIPMPEKKAVKPTKTLKKKNTKISAPDAKVNTKEEEPK